MPELARERGIFQFILTLHSILPQNIAFLEGDNILSPHILLVDQKNILSDKWSSNIYCNFAPVYHQYTKYTKYHQIQVKLFSTDSFPKPRAIITVFTKPGDLRHLLFCQRCMGNKGGAGGGH